VSTEAEPVITALPSTLGEPAVVFADAGDPDPRRKLIFFIVAIGLFMASVDATIVATAIKPIGMSLHSRINWTAWTVTIYQLGQIIAMPVAGKISDQFGRKKVYLISAAVFTATSLACGLSSSIGMLVAFRFIQALGGGAFMPSATGIVSDHFGRDRDKALGMFTSIFPIGGIVGPVFGGVITQDWSWRGIFFVNLPIGVVLLVLGIKFIPKSIPKPSGGIDIRGVCLLAAMILSGMFAISILGNLSAASPAFYLPLVAAVLLGVGFVRHTKRDPAPFIPLRLIAGKGFASMNVLNVFYGTAALGFGALVPLYAENRYHIQIANAGTLLSARAIGMICIAAAAAMMLRRTGYRLPMIVGFTAIAIGLVMLFVKCPHGFPPYWWLAAWSMLTGLGMGVAAPATNNATLQLAPDQVAQIAGLRGTFRQSGGILYVSLATALLARSANPGLAQSHFFLVQAAVLMVMISLVFMVPEHKGSW
jgi:EmrB/QacA subfamily drug resistance transporter